MDLSKDRVWGDIMQCTAIIFQHMKVVTQNRDAEDEDDDGTMLYHQLFQ